MVNLEHYAQDALQEPISEGHVDFFRKIQSILLGWSEYRREGLKIVENILSEDKKQEKKHFVSARLLADVAGCLERREHREVKPVLGLSFGHAHAWIQIRHGHIIDLLPIGVESGPLLLHCRSLRGPRLMYRPVTDRTVFAEDEEFFKSPAYIEVVQHVYETLRGRMYSFPPHLDSR